MLYLTIVESSIGMVLVQEDDECWPLTNFWEILGHIDLFWDFNSLSKEERKTKQRSRDIGPLLGPFWVFGIM
jgi:hypothetical protein